MLKKEEEHRADITKIDQILQDFSYENNGELSILYIFIKF